MTKHDVLTSLCLSRRASARLMLRCEDCSTGLISGRKLRWLGNTGGFPCSYCGRFGTLERVVEEAFVHKGSPLRTHEETSTPCIGPNGVPYPTRKRKFGLIGCGRSTSGARALQLDVPTGNCRAILVSRQSLRSEHGYLCSPLGNFPD